MSRQFSKQALSNLRAQAAKARAAKAAQLAAQNGSIHLTSKTVIYVPGQEHGLLVGPDGAIEFVKIMLFPSREDVRNESQQG